jgi:hypothetical protein
MMEMRKNTAIMAKPVGKKRMHRAMTDFTQAIDRAFG